MASVPSHDTFNRIFQAIRTEHFGDSLIGMTSRLRKEISGEIIAFDGKTHCGTGDGAGSALHMLNAWPVKDRLVLGQLPVSDKSNEISAMPQLLDILELNGSTVTKERLAEAIKL